MAFAGVFPAANPAKKWFEFIKSISLVEILRSTSFRSE